MTMPTPYEVGHQRWVPTGRDAQNNETGHHREPEPRPAYGWEVVSSSEPATQGHERAVTKVRLFAPAFEISDRDLIVLPGIDIEWRVDGDPRIWDTGPFGYTPGMDVDLIHVKG